MGNFFQYILCEIPLLEWLNKKIHENNQKTFRGIMIKTTLSITMDKIGRICSLLLGYYTISWKLNIPAFKVRIDTGVTILRLSHVFK